jgi:2-polyprenyl-6-methoxyphenol hydroxylase-like FAD-dependent oxidoreductase
MLQQLWHLNNMAFQTLETDCCVVGGGPAGMMLGYLLARAGVQVAVLEKHADFFRDFRGDTVHPSTLEVFGELGLLERFLKLPHQELTSAGATVGDFSFQGVSFRHVPARCKFIAMMPQWDFLDFLAGEARKFPSFDLRMQHECIDVIEDGLRVAGVLARTPDGDVEIRARLVVGCDGRRSAVRSAARLDLMEFGVPFDVLWFRMGRRAGDHEQVLGYVNYGKALILINRGDYFQAGMIVRKGSSDEVKRRGLGEFRHSILQIAPFLAERVCELRSWDQVNLLTVKLNRLRRWHRPGLLCIGDAAHAMSPAGGVGINLAIQDAVAAARLLAGPLRQGRLDEYALARVQQRREFPARLTQFIQMGIHAAFARVFQNPGPTRAPWQLKVAVRIPGLPRLLGRAVGIGVRPEHIPDAICEAPRPRRARVLPICAGIVTALAVAGSLLARTALRRDPRRIAPALH